MREVAMGVLWPFHHPSACCDIDRITRQTQQTEMYICLVHISMDEEIPPSIYQQPLHFTLVPGAIGDTVIQNGNRCLVQERTDC